LVLAAEDSTLPVLLSSLTFPWNSLFPNVVNLI